MRDVCTLAIGAAGSGNAMGLGSPGSIYSETTIGSSYRIDIARTEGNGAMSTSRRRSSGSAEFFRCSVKKTRTDSHHLKPLVTMGRKRESRTVLRVPFARLLEQVECARQLVSLVRQAVR